MTDNTEKLSDVDFKRELAALIPHLRAFARSLCGDATLADDLAQDAMLKAWNARASFQAGTNMKAWAFTILRNVFYSEKRRSWRRTPLDPEVAEATLVSNSNPSDTLDLLAMRNALGRLPIDQREALILVGAGGLPYEGPPRFVVWLSALSRAASPARERLLSKSSNPMGQAIATTPI